MRWLLTPLGLLLALPVLGVLGSWLAWDDAAFATLQHQWRTVLPEYLRNSLLLAACVGAGVALLGVCTAAAVSLFAFPGRRFFEWALLLPLALPAYVMAYAYTDFLQYGGALHAALQSALGTRLARWPDVRSLPGAVPLFVLCLYPYVYLLVRGTLHERAAPLLDAARTLGAGTLRRVREVALPLARPAIAAGVALALMETLADYGVGSYFGLATVTTGIYKAWLALNDRIAAAQLATVLLAAVALLLWLERRAQTRLRFATARPGAHARPLPLRGGPAAAAVLLCAVPVVFGFVVPVAVLLRLWLQDGDAAAQALVWPRFVAWAWTSLKLSASAALLTLAFALALGFALRGGAGAALRWIARVVGMGYAVPGAVIAVGILLPLGWLQQVAPHLGLGTLFTATVFGLLYAYLVRFSAVGMQAIEAGYARIPERIDESARLLGAGGLRRFVELHAPLLRRPALAAALLVFVDVMKELPATLLLRPFDSDTLAVVAYQLARDERLAEAALPSLAIVAVGLIPVWLLSRALRAA